MKQTIFHLEDRGGKWIFHFIYYNLIGLYLIENGLYDTTGHDANKNGSTYPLLNKVVSKPSTVISYPIKIHMNKVEQFQRDAFKIIQNKFILIEDILLEKNYEIVNIYGGSNISYSPVMINYIRNLFISNAVICNNMLTKKKRIFITRKNSEQYHNNILKRYILNENQLMDSLREWNFEYIQLELLDFKNKILLFMNSEIIISSHGSQLSFICFCNAYTKIIEICNKGTIGFPNDQIHGVASALKYNYRRYNNVNEDINGNFYLGISEFKNYLKRNILNE